MPTKRKPNPKATSKQSQHKPQSRGKNQRFSKRQRDIESVDMRSSARLPADARSERDDYHAGKPNDWRWYAQNPQLVHDYASFPFGQPLGNLMQYGDGTLDRNAVPGVMAIHFAPTIGWADSENSPINVAMRRLYSYVRHANSGASNYEAPDLMLYMLSVDSAVMYHEFLKRVYGVLNDYTAFNRYYPKSLVAAMGVDFDSITANIAAFRGYINQFAIKLSQLWIPNSMSYMARHAWMCQGLYTDATDEKAQTYLYVPDYYFQFSIDTGDHPVGMVTAIPAPGAVTPATYEQLVTFGNSLLNPMIVNEDFGIMSGDILKAFGSSGIIAPTAISEGYQVVPVYDQEVLSQMENATIWELYPSAGTDRATPLCTVKQATAVGTGYLMSTPTFILKVASSSVNPLKTPDETLSKLLNPYAGRQLLNMHHSGVTPEEVMVATRLTNAVSSFGPVQYSTQLGAYVTSPIIKTFGSEIVTRALIYSFEGNSSGAVINTKVLSVSKVMSAVVDAAGASTTPIRLAGAVSGMLDAVAALSAFDWHPGIYTSVIAASNNASGGTEYAYPTLYPVQDISFYTMIDGANLENMTTAALLSEFSIPQI